MLSCSRQTLRPPQTSCNHFSTPYGTEGKSLMTGFRGIIIKILKKGALSECSNWRGITLLSTPSKILAKVIMKRLSLAVGHKLRVEQAGFRRGRGYIDHIFTLRNIIEQSTEWQRTLFVNFVDLPRSSTVYTDTASGRYYEGMESPPTLLRLSKFSMITLPARLLMVTSYFKSTLVSDRGVSSPHCFSTLLCTGSCGAALRIRSGASDGCPFPIFISRDGGTYLDIQSRLNKARNSLNMMNKVWHSSAYSTLTKLKLYHSCVLSTLLYGSECWRLTEIYRNSPHFTPRAFGVSYASIF